ncbi:hypothetical protein ES705_19070 [subsurface metagenome]
MEYTQRYISNILTHFLGRDLISEDMQFNLLKKILKEGWLTHPPHNPNISGNLQFKLEGDVDLDDMFSPQMICFADIPLNDLKLQMEKYSKFGVCFLKDFLIKKGANPVFYLAKNSEIITDCNVIFQDNKTIVQNMTSNRKIFFEDNIKNMFKYFERLHDIFLQKPEAFGISNEFSKIHKIKMFLSFHIFGYMKAWNHDNNEEDPENYYFEREWRIIGNLKFQLGDVVRIVLPRKYAKLFREEFKNYNGEIIFSDW